MGVGAPSGESSENGHLHSEALEPTGSPFGTIGASRGGPWVPLWRPSGILEVIFSQLFPTLIFYNLFMDF